MKQMGKVQTIVNEVCDFYECLGKHVLNAKMVRANLTEPRYLIFYLVTKHTLYPYRWVCEFMNYDNPDCGPTPELIRKYINGRDHMFKRRLKAIEACLQIQFKTYKTYDTTQHSDTGGATPG